MNLSLKYTDQMNYLYIGKIYIPLKIKYRVLLIYFHVYS